jgi:hypothetical protein
MARAEKRGAGRKSLLEYYDLWRVRFVWDWPEGAPLWEDVGCQTFTDWVGRFRSREEVFRYVRDLKVDGLYCMAPPDDGTGTIRIEQFELFEGRWV